MNGCEMNEWMKTLFRKGSWVAVAAVFSACASSGPQKYLSFFQSVEKLRTHPTEGQPLLQSACGQGSLAACAVLGQEVPHAEPLPILQGPTGEASTQVVVLARLAQEVQVFLWDLTEFRLQDPTEARVVEVPGGLGRLLHFKYEGLKSEARYSLQIVGAAGELLDARELQTIDTNKKIASIALASCMDDGHPLATQVWQELAKTEPDALFLLGDNVYADKGKGLTTGNSVQALWDRYSETRRTLSLFFLPRLIPVFATWDDHDYGQNDGDRTFPLRAQAKEIFKAFFGGFNLPGVWEQGPGVASRFTGFGQRFVLLDNRSFRSPPKDKSQTHFGADQEAWLLTELSSEMPTWLLSGDQFFGKYHGFESYEGQRPGSFTRFLKRLKAQSSKVAFFSGDRHLAEVMQMSKETLGYPTFEVTTSSIHAAVYPSTWDKTPNPRQVEGVAGVNNYAVVRSEVGQGWALDVRVFGPGNKRLISRQFEIIKP
jgi:alkaline phosphatase D